MCFRSLAKNPCGVFLKGISTNSIFCGGCSSWIHKKCSGIPGRLKSDVRFRCKQCTGQVRPINGRLITEVTVGGEKLEMVPSFCFPGDCLYSGGGCELTTITRCRVTWGKFNVLTSRSFPITSRRRVYNLCVKSAMLHTSETWAPTSSDLHHLQRGDRAMICWMCGVTTKDQVSSQDLLERMQLDNLAKVLRTWWLRRHGHAERSDGWLKKVQKLNPTGGSGRGRPKKTWTEVIDMECLALGLTETHPFDRKAWRTGPPLL